MTVSVHHSFICPIMVGRDLPTKTLVQMFEQARNGYGQFALVSGEAGIGKSRLLREFRARVGTAQILQGNCYELDQTQPYAAFIDLLRPLLSSSDNTPHSAFLHKLSRLLPGLSGDLSGLAHPEMDKQQLTQTFTHLFLNLGQAGPLVIMIEDLHWCDDASLEYLSYLAQQIANEPVLTILTWRSDELTSSLLHCVAEIERTRRATEFHLTALNLAETSAMVSGILSPGFAIDADFLEELHHLTDGNPFFIEEMLRSLVAFVGKKPVKESWSRHMLAQVQIPRTVQAVVQQRIDLLPAAARRALTLAAVVGRHFDFTLLQHLTGQRETEVLDCLRELITAGLVIEKSPDQFAFRHALTQQAVYITLLARERRTLHRAVANGIEQLYLGNQRSLWINDLAHHSYQGEMWSQAMVYSIEAGELARQLYSPISTVEHYTHALLAARHHEAIVPPSLYQVRGKMYEMLGEFEAARGDFEQAIEAGRQHHDIAAEAQGLLALGFLWTASDYDRAGAYFQRAAVVAQGADNPLLLAAISNRIGLWHTHAEHPFEGLRHHEQALSIYRQLDDQEGTGETLDLLGVTAFMSGDLQQGWRYFEQAIGLCRANEDRPRLATLLLTASIRGGALLVETLVEATGSPQEGIDQCEEAIQIARDLHLPATEAYARILLAHVLGWHGVFGRALTEAETALAIAQEIEHRMWQINAQVILGWLHLELLDDAAALDYLEQAMHQTQGMQSLYIQYLVSSVLSRGYVVRHQLQQANQVLSRFITPDLPMQTLAQRLVWTAQVELLLAEDKPQKALSIVNKLIETARNCTETTVIPRLWYLKGQALVALHRRIEAQDVFQAGYDAALMSGNRPLTWRIALELGNLQIAQGKRESAQDVFDIIREMIQQLADELSAGALRDHFYTHAIRRLPRSRLISPQKAAKRTFDGLTQREREVAALIAQGSTNAAIAQALTLSERTIEKHVENIMNKLGVNARTQIAVWAAGKQLNG
jgi:DNA-binding NarL/FixJ family response regulator